MPDEMNKREVILTIREYENSVAMPEGERVTYLDPCGPMGAVITRLARLRPTSSWLSTAGRTSPATSTTSSRPIGSSIMTKKEAGNSMHLRSYICFGATSSNPTSIGLLYADRSA